MRSPIVGAIADLEARHQERANAIRRQWQRVVATILYGVALAMALLLYVMQWVLAVAQIPPSDLTFNTAAGSGLFFLAIYLTIYTIFQHGILILKTLNAGAYSMTREKEARRWEVLMLTGVDARAVVCGKWWGTLRAAFRDIVRLVPLRIGLAMLVTNVVWAATFFADTTRYNHGGVPPAITGILLVPPLMFALTVAGVALAAAVGVMVSPLCRRPAFAFGSAIIVYLLYFGGALGLAAFIADLLDPLFAEWFGRVNHTYYFLGDVLLALQATIMDNGTLLAGSLAGIQPVRGDFAKGTGLWIAVGIGTTVIIMLGIMILAVFGSLRIAEYFAVRKGLLPKTQST